MRPTPPSPSMVVAIVALVMATTGSAVAAVDFARNAGAVDGKSAVGASSSLKGAKGKLVATQAGGVNSGKIPGKFVADVIGGNGGITTIARAQDVNDGMIGAPVQLAVIPGFGTITSVCRDQAPPPGNENPAQDISFNNASGEAVSYAREVGANDAVITVPANGTSTPFTINGSNTFRIILHKGSSSVTIDGIARQDGSGTPTAQCFTAAQLIVEF